MYACAAVQIASVPIKSMVRRVDCASPSAIIPTLTRPESVIRYHTMQTIAPNFVENCVTQWIGTCDKTN